MGPQVRFDLQIRANRVNERINIFTGSENPEFRVGIYGELGRGENSETLSRDLICFLNEQQRFDSEVRSYWAVFYDTQDLTDVQFEEKVRAELSYITDAMQMNKNRELKFNVDTKEKNISFNLGDEEFFVIGLHRNSSISTRRFHYATLVFSKDESLYPYQSH